MTQPEAKLSRQIMAAIRLEGAFCYKVHGSELTMAGLPDIIVCIRGHFLGLETKMPNKRSNTSPRQDYVHEQIREAGGTVHVVTSVVEAVAIVRALV